MPSPSPRSTPPDSPSVQLIAEQVRSGETGAAVLLLAQHVTNLSAHVAGLHASIETRLSKGEFRRGIAAIGALLTAVLLLLISAQLH